MDDPIAHLQGLLDRLESATARLESAPDAATAADVLHEIDDAAQAVSTEVERQRRAVGDEDAADPQLGLL